MGGYCKAVSEIIRKSVGSVENVFDWAREVREESHKYIESLTEDDLHKIPPTSHGVLSVAPGFLLPLPTLLHTLEGFSFSVQSLKTSRKGRVRIRRKRWQKNLRI